MSFLNPIMLFGLAAVSVPIIIHLLNRRRFQKIQWAAMRFLKISVEQNQKRMRIEDLILLALRCLLLLLLALALARPALLSSANGAFGQSKVTAVIVLDNSYSMGTSDGTRTRFEKAQDAALQALDSMPAGSATALLYASDVVNAAIPEPTFDLNLARKLIREAPLTDRGTDLFPALQKAVDTLKGRLVIRKEIYLITDGQSAGWRQLAEIQNVLERAKTEINSHLILVSEHETQNLGLSNLRLASGLSPARQALRFQAKVTNYGTEERRNTRVALSVDEEPPCDEFNIDALPPGATRSVSLFAKLPTAGFHAITARIPEDRLHADDRRLMAVRAIDEVRVLLVDGEPGNEPRDSEVFFLHNALVPVPPEMAPNYFVKVTALTSSEFSQARLDEYDAIFLANVPDFSEKTLQALESYLRRGGGLIIFPGGRVNVTFYNEQLLKRFNFLPAALGSALGQVEDEFKFTRFQDKDYTHPIVSIWNDPSAGTLASARIFKWFALQPAPPVKSSATQPATADNQHPQEAGDPRIVLKYADGSPAVMERTWGLGRVVLFSSTADTAWNDLPVRLAWLPLVHRTLGAIIERQDEGLNIRVGEQFVRRVKMEYLDKDATFFKPRQTDAVRDLRRVELVNGWPLLQYRQTDLAGLYDVNIPDPPLTMKFATQANAAESSLEELSPAQLKTIGSVAQIITWTPNLVLTDVVEQARSGLEFWLPIAIAALLVAAVETFLAQWFSRAK